MPTLGDGDIAIPFAHHSPGHNLVSGSEAIDSSQADPDCGEQGDRSRGSWDHPGSRRDSNPWSSQSHSPNGHGESQRTTLLTDELLLHYQRCQRRAYLDRYADPAKRDPTSDYVRKLQHDSVVHQAKILSAYTTHRPASPPHDWDAGFAATLALMQAGVNYIERPVLQVHYSDTITFLSRPKLLVRQPGLSHLGDWTYLAADIKLGKRPKADYQIVATFHAYLLAHIQGRWPAGSWLILRHGNRYAVKLPEQLPKMEAAVLQCLEMLQNNREPKVFISRNRCDLCHWFGHCYSVAQAEAHLSLLPGVTPSRYAHLQSLNLTTVEALAQATFPAIASLPGFGRQTAHKLVRQAQATYQDRALRLPPDSVPSPPLHQWLPTAPIELYFDIESAPEQGLIYLHGVVVVDREAHTQTFHGLMAESPGEEGKIWQQFLDLMAQYPTAPVFHFCPYEAQTVKKLGDTYGTPAAIVEQILARFVDLHDRVIHSVTLPIENYALKAIARWVGFEWREAGANGAQSIFWYDQWLETGDRTYLDLLLSYNEDDCLATWKVKNWLVQFLQDEPV
ncbi:MAG: TM0106 family RecB-like putative nuclease [Leptolyngbyaceae bacterium]|nr:TM0106 family RecB-like putative nuclease [Leptolyngbyaceae bacterium]